MVKKPRELSEVTKPLQDPGSNQVRIRVEACGACHSDSATVDRVYSGITYPRVPGHEVVGRIDVLGSGVKSLGSWSASRRRVSRWRLRLLRVLVPLVSLVWPMLSRRIRH